MGVKCELYKAVYLEVKCQSAYCNILESHNLQLKLLCFIHSGSFGYAVLLVLKLKRKGREQERFKLRLTGAASAHDGAS